MKWFRMYSEVARDPKVQMLPLVQLRAWLNCLCLASDNPRRGYLPDLQMIAFTLQTTEPKAKIILESLIAAGLFDRDEDGGIRPHNWDARQHKTDDIASRVANWRKGKKTAAEVGSVMSPPTSPPTPDVTLQPTLDPTLPVTPVQRCRPLRATEFTEGTENTDSNAAAASSLNGAAPYPQTQTGGGGGYENFILSDEHRQTVEHARALFGDAHAAAVAEHGADIDRSLEGRFDAYRAALDALDDHRKRGRPEVKAPHVWCIRTGGRFLRDYPTGLPPKSAPVGPAAAAVALSPFAAKQQRLHATLKAMKANPPDDPQESR